MDAREAVMTSDELSQVLQDAMRRHVTVVRSDASRVPGFTTFVLLDKDVRVPYEPAPSHIRAGIYVVRDGDADRDPTLYALAIDEQRMAEVLEGAKADIESGREPDAGASFGMNVEPLRTWGGHLVTIAEAMAWYAISDAGNAEEARRLYRAVYEDEEGTPEAAEAAGEKRPLVMRTGKVFTEAMRATDRRGVYEHEDGGEFLMAGSLMVRTNGTGRLAATVGMNKTLMYLNHLATISGYGYEEGRSCIVHTTIDELLERRGLDPTRKNRDRVRSDLQALARWAWEFEDVNTKAWVRVPLAGGVKIARGGAVTFSLTPEFMREIINRRAGLLPADPALMRTDDKRNPNAFTIGYKLMTHSYQNAGETNQNTLSVSRLLDYVETIPRREDVKNRAYTQRIIEPMERDLTALVGLGVLEWWDYCHVKGEPLTDEEQAERFGEDGNERALPYEIAIKANIQWQLSNSYEDEIAKTIEARGRRRKEAADAKTKRRRRAGRARS